MTSLQTTGSFSHYGQRHLPNLKHLAKKQLGKGSSNPVLESCTGSCMPKGGMCLLEVSQKESMAFIIVKKTPVHNSEVKLRSRSCIFFFFSALFIFFLPVFSVFFCSEEHRLQQQHLSKPLLLFFLYPKWTAITI